MGRYNLRPRNASGFVSRSLIYSSINLRLLSSELRDIVFALSLLQTDGETPALLIALRPDDCLYRQALKVFYTMNELEISSNGFSSLKDEVKGMVKMVVVTVRHNTTSVSALHASLLTLPNLTSLKLRAPNTSLLQTFNIASLLTPSPPLPSQLLNFQSLAKLTVEVWLKTSIHPGGHSGGVFGGAQRWADEYDAKQMVKKVKGLVEKLLGVEGKERYLGQELEIVLLMWEAGKGTVLGEVEVEEGKGKGKVVEQ